MARTRAWQFKPRRIEASPATRNNRTHTCGLHRIQDNLSETNRITTEDAAEAEIDRRFTACEKILKLRWWSPVFGMVEKPVSCNGRRFGPISRSRNN